MIHLAVTVDGDIVLTDNLGPTHSWRVFLPKQDAHKLAFAILQALERKTSAGIVTNPQPILTPLGTPIQRIDE